MPAGAHDAHRTLLTKLGFSEMRTPELSEEDVVILKQPVPELSSTELIDAYKRATRQNAFIEQNGLGSRWSSGQGVTATLMDGSNWLLERDLTPSERQQLLEHGFTNNSLFAQSLIATRH